MKLYKIGQIVYPWDNSCIEKVSGPGPLELIELEEIGESFYAPICLCAIPDGGIYTRFPKYENGADFIVVSEPYEHVSKYGRMEMINVKSTNSGNVYRIINNEKMENSTAIEFNRITDEIFEELNDYR